MTEVASDLEILRGGAFQSVSASIHAPGKNPRSGRHAPPTHHQPPVAIAHFVHDLNGAFRKTRSLQLNAGRSSPQRNVNPSLGLNPPADLARIIGFQPPLPHKQPNEK